MIEKIVRHNLKVRDEVGERIKTESEELLDGVVLTSLDSLDSQLTALGVDFAKYYEQEIQGAALDGVELAEAIERESGVSN